MQRGAIWNQGKWGGTACSASRITGTAKLWSCWKKTVERRVTWGELWASETAQIKFKFGATYDQLPTPAILPRWKMAGSDKCRAVACSAKGTLAQVCSNCRQSLSKAWRHYRVLAVLEKAALELWEDARDGVSSVVPKCMIKLVSAGLNVYPKGKITARSELQLLA